jgi:hypothetical protein
MPPLNPDIQIHAVIGLHRPFPGNQHFVIHVWQGSLGSPVKVLRQLTIENNRTFYSNDHIEEITPGVGALCASLAVVSLL